MKIHIITLFPQLIKSYFSTSIVARACETQLVNVHIVNLRDYALDAYKNCDDEPYGGGRGMILKAEPLSAALDSILSSRKDSSQQKGKKDKRPLVLFPTPAAPLFTQKDALTLSQKEELICICGRYEGIDQRIIDMYVDRVFSIGEYVLSSGELASMVILDASIRLIRGVIHEKSLEDESYTNSLLEYPHYTRPAEFRGVAVPEVLLSGNHKHIAHWREKQKYLQTKEHRPDLLSKQ